MAFFAIAFVVVFSGAESDAVWQTNLDPDQIKELEAAREEGCDDVARLSEAEKKLMHFKQANDRSYGLPSDVEELERMQSAAEKFVDDDLEDIEDLLKSLKKKYKCSNYEEISDTIRLKYLNPPEWVGGRPHKCPTPASTRGMVVKLEWIKEFMPKLEAALKDAKKDAKAMADKQKEPKKLTEFPADAYSGKDLDEIKAQMLKVQRDSAKKSSDEVINLSVTSDWTKGIYRDTKIPYRTIRGTALFVDSDGDGASYYTSFKYISDKIDDEWQPLKLKNSGISPSGYAKAEKGSLEGSSSGGGFVGKLLWLLLVLSNILAGIIAGQSLIKPKLPAIEKISEPLAPFSMPIGLVALCVGILSFILSLLGLRPLAGIIPQATAVLLGIVLASDFIKEKAKGKLEGQEARLEQVNAYSQLIGIAGLIAGVIYLFTRGALYLI